MATTPGRVGRPRDPRLDDAMVRAAVDLLEERGYNDLSLVAVAERAGTTTAAIYRRWGSKAELVLDAVFRTEGDDVVAETGDLADDLATMIRWSVDKICRPAALAAVAGILGEPRSVRSAQAVTASGAAKRVVERLERAQASGQIRADVDAGVVASLIAGPVLYAAFVGGSETVDGAWVADQVAIVLDGVRSGRPSASPKVPPPPDPSEVERR